MENNELFANFFHSLNEEIRRTYEQRGTLNKLVETKNLLNNFLNSEKFDLDLYRQICNVLPLPYTPEQIQNYITFLHQNLEYETFELQINKCNSNINKTYELIKEKLAEINIKLSSISELDEKIAELNSLNELSATTGLINSQTITLVVEYANKLSFEPAFVNALVFEMVSHNADFIKNEYEKIISRVPKRKKRKVRRIDGDLQTLINQAQAIANTNFEMDDKLECAISLLEPNQDIDDKIEIYSSYDNAEIANKIIAYDLKNNIIPMILNHEMSQDAAKKLLSIVLSEYQVYSELLQEENIVPEKTFLEKLDELELTSEKERSLNVEDLLETVSNLLLNPLSNNKNLTNEVYEKLYIELEELKNVYAEFRSAIDTLYEDREDAKNIDLKNSTFEALNKKYADLEELYEDKIISDDKYIKLADEFYSQAADQKNIYIFLGDEDGTSFIEQDMGGKLFENKDLVSNVVALLNQNLGNNFYSDGNHRVKSEHYSEEFKNKYKIKSMKSPQIRVSYGRHNSTLQQIYPEFGDDPHIIILYALGYGRVDTSKKKESFDEAWKRCYDNRDKVDRIIEIFNTDWGSVPEFERETLKLELDEILRYSKIKLGKFISKAKGMGENQK